MTSPTRVAATAFAAALAFTATACETEVRYTKRPKRHHSSATPFAWADKVKPTERDGASVTGDKKLATRRGELTRQEAAATRKLTSASGALTYVQDQTDQTSFCRDAVWGLDRFLLDADCDQVTRAVYRSTDGTYQALLAVIDVRDAKAAERLRTALTTEEGFLKLPKGTRFHRATKWSRARVTGLGHYVTITWLQPVDAGRAIADGPAEFARSAPRDPWTPILRAHG